MMEPGSPAADSDYREGLVHKMKTTIHKIATLASYRHRGSDSATGSGRTPRSVALNARPAFIAMALLATIAVGMLFLLPGSPLHAQTGDGTIEYAENGMEPVATYTAEDPEGSAIVSWSLAGDDADDFKIEDGVLSFKSKDGPNYEDGTDGDRNNDGDHTDTDTEPDEEASDNIYMVTVQATDATKRIGTEEVTVEVTNVEEGGSMRLSAVQPQAGTSFYVIGETDAARINDEDEITSSIKWQWSRSRSKTAGFRDIDKATNPSYTPKDTDNSYYLRVTASYTDREGPNKSVQATSDYAVQLAPSNNAAPKFADDQDPDTDGDQAVAPRSIAENTMKGVDIGSPIEAEDLNPGKLTYTLEGDAADHFDIDRETGQLKTKGKLDADTTASYGVTVRATDPSGDPQADSAVEDNSASITVTITVDNLDEDPQISSDESIAGFAENGDITADLATFRAVTEDGTGTVSRWSLAGPDGSKFTIVGGELMFAKQPDYEMPGDDDEDNMYEVTVQATDTVGRTGTRDVTVEVTNFDEEGTVTLSPTQHRVGVPITAMLEDPDGGVYGKMWQWYDGTFAPANPNDNAIAGATSDTYTPKAGDVSDTLTATVTYRDAAGGDVDDSAMLAGAAAVLRDTRNKAPSFKDSKGNTITMAERSVAETAKGVDDTTDDATDNVGGTFRVEDPNVGAEDAEGDSLAFSLSGADASKFRLRDAVPDADDATMLSVQVEVKGNPKFDYETKDTYVVTLTATDDYGETADLELTINITDANEAPVITKGGLAISGDSSVEVEEGTTAVETYTASGPDAASATWSLSGDDAGDLSISSSGVLTFRSAPDFEAPGSEDGDNVYTVTVEADDGTYTAMRPVTVTVTNDEADDAVEPMPGETLLERYDADNSDEIEKPEMLKAIRDYQFGQGDASISKDDVLAIIRMFQFP